MASTLLQYSIDTVEKRSPVYFVAIIVRIKEEYCPYSLAAMTPL